MIQNDHAVECISIEIGRYLQLDSLDLTRSITCSCSFHYSRDYISILLVRVRTSPISFPRGNPRVIPFGGGLPPYAARSLVDEPSPRECLTTSPGSLAADCPILTVVKPSLCLTARSGSEALRGFQQLRRSINRYLYRRKRCISRSLCQNV